MTNYIIIFFFTSLCPPHKPNICSKLPHDPSRDNLWTCWWRYRKSQRITKVSRIHLLGTMKVCKKVPYNSCLNISVWTNFGRANIATLRAMLLAGLKSWRHYHVYITTQGLSSVLTLLSTANSSSFRLIWCIFFSFDGATLTVYSRSQSLCLARLT